MKLWLPVLLATLLGQTSLSQESVPEPVQIGKPLASAQFEGNAESIDEGPSFSRSIGVGLAFKHAKELSQILRYSLHLKLKLESGSFRGIYSDEYLPRNELRIREALLQLQPYKPLAFSFGSLDQNDLLTPTLVNNESFPGMREDLRLSVAGVEVQAIAQQAVATSTYIGEHYSRDFDAGIPGFYLERLRFRYERQALELSAHASHFSYNNLPASVAYESRFLGNSATGNGENGSRFAHGFQGPEFSFGFQTGLTGELGLGGRVSQLENTLAPSNVNQARFANLSLKLPTWLLSATWLRIERDASPALYNISWLGHNNRQGYGLSIEKQYAGFNFSLEGGESRPIEDIPFQDRFVTLQFKIGKSHDFL